MLPAGLNFLPTGLLPSVTSLSRLLRLGLMPALMGVPQPPALNLSLVSLLNDRLNAGFGLAPFRSPLLGGSMFLSLPPATKMFQFAGLPLHTYVFSVQ